MTTRRQTALSTTTVENEQRWWTNKPGLLDDGRVVTLSAFAVKVLSALWLTKLVAAWFGPTEMARLAEAQMVNGFALLLAGSFLTQAVTQRAAVLRKHPRHWQRFLQTVLTLVAIAGLCLTMLLLTIALGLVLSKRDGLIPPADWATVAVCVTTGAWLSVLVAACNGMMQQAMAARLQATTAIAQAILATPLVIGLGAAGGLAALCTGQAIGLIIGLLGLRRGLLWPSGRLIGLLHRPSLRWIAGFAPMALCSAVIGPMVQIAVFNRLETRVSIDDIGRWQAVYRLSDAIVLAAASLIVAWYLPRWAAETAGKPLQRLWWRSSMTLVTLAAACFAVIYATRHVLIPLLFSGDFLPATQWLAVQLAADLMRVLGLCAAYLLVARAMTRRFIVIEAVSALLLLLWVELATRFWGLHGLFYAQAFNWLLYLAVALPCAFRQPRPTR